MRLTFLTFITLIAGTFANTAQADQYKWCAVMGGGNDGGMTNCYFVTLPQCKEYVRGVGGFCMPSPYDGNIPAASWGQTIEPQHQQPMQRKRNPS